MEILHRVVGPVATNVWILGDEASREAIAIDTATPCVGWLTGQLAERGWTLKLIVSTHRHWDHIGDNAAVSAATGADIAVHGLDRHGLEHPAAANGASASEPSTSRSSTPPGTRRARYACWRERRASCSAATPSSPAPGAGPT